MSNYMKREDRARLEQNRKRRHTFLHFAAGLRELVRHEWKCLFILAHLLIFLALWHHREILMIPFGPSLLLPLLKTAIDFLVLLLGALSLFGLVIIIGTPVKAKDIQDNLLRIGFTNRAGETPILLARYKYRKNPKITVLEFANNGTPKTDWQDNQAKLEAALNLTIIKMEYGKSTRRIILRTVPAKNALPQILYWKDEYLLGENFELVLGESLTGRETVNLAKIPHLLLGGSSGSGKSVLLKLLLMQCVKKGSAVYIADFKGGVDFSGTWHEKCRMCFDEADLLELLTDLVAELERRKDVFRLGGCPNIDAYNKSTGNLLQRIIFAVDEVAEVLDKTGLSKEHKELVSHIEGLLSVIARQGRAFGVHLILATQRPDATILAGQIRNNIDLRVCGRADSVLSQIILDSTTAADQIPKDAQGRFITHEGVVFQSYLFDEKTAFEGMEP